MWSDRQDLVRPLEISAVAHRRLKLVAAAFATATVLLLPWIVLLKHSNVPGWSTWLLPPGGFAVWVSLERMVKAPR
jgi:hypothetical protein